MGTAFHLYHKQVICFVTWQLRSQPSIFNIHLSSQKFRNMCKACVYFGYNFVIVQGLGKLARISQARVRSPVYDLQFCLSHLPYSILKELNFLCSTFCYLIHLKALKAWQQDFSVWADPGIFCIYQTETQFVSVKVQLDG